ncbi:MAG: NAD(P)H-hydrate dehydratase, partial [Kiritimatiellaeota bacterium]|nr:NAD(P)H-hydrate dehydratase [Kiritimatiellota bacterium]
EAWRGMGLASTPAPDVVVDGLLGTGTQGPPDALFTAAIGFVNTLGRHALVLSVDVPSGMGANGGETSGACVRADVTLAVSAPKKGFLKDLARPLLGHVAVADIGIPLEWQDSDAATRMAAAPVLSALLPPRDFDAHKGNFGHVLVLGGSEEYTGAPVLTARAALAAGAGKVTLAAPAGSRASCAAAHPEIILLPMDAEIPWDKFQALVLGPGIGATDTGYSLASRVIRAAPEKLPMVVDADALRVLYGMHFPHPSRVVMTPHAGEAAPLLGQTASQVNKKRAAAVNTLATKFKCTTVLKGAGTLVAQPNAMLSLNMTGNPGMAVAGSGDMLAGIVGALLARGLAQRDAARLAAWLHGAAGDFAAWRRGQEGMTTSDIISALPDAFSLLRREGAASFNEPKPEPPEPAQETPAQ